MTLISHSRVDYFQQLVNDSNLDFTKASAILMTEVEIIIKKITDNSFPMWVECELTDASGTIHIFSDKLPIFEEISEIPLTSSFPRKGKLRCSLIEVKSNTVVIDTELPDGLESLEGTTRFTVVRDLVDIA